MGTLVTDNLLNATGSSTTASSSFSWSFYALLLTKFTLYTVFTYTMFVSVMAFHARISDPLIGGTYMTLLNTASNLGESLLLFRISLSWV
ncbi:unnamed protein product [Protopolystoma xenopodis]|uniref:Uncharacterized protein n=1 Tax=Protopolystoma xenopodis TaxID=117903 RepID=A0A3S5A1E3_9PLAT|nr:unnamed protein product [Protopolystoma xenopodis]